VSRLPGIHQVEVSLERAEAVVRYDPDRITPADIVVIINRLSFNAHLLPEPRRPEPRVWHPLPSSFFRDPPVLTRTSRFRAVDQSSRMNLTLLDAWHKIRRL
jgi:hypothetical protein